MRKVLAALDNSLAGRPVIAAARALAAVLEAEATAVHVQIDGDRTARSTADAAGIEFRTLVGPVVATLVEAGDADDVAALAVGARGTPFSRRPLGSTAEAIASALSKPVIIVPPDTQPLAFRRVLVPLEGSPLSPQPAAIFELPGTATVDVIALHVCEQASIPAFTDHPHHEDVAWTREFLARYCPRGLGRVQLERRVGRAEELVPLVAEQCGCDLIALAWSQDLAPGRAPVVRGTLERTHLPVLLVPVRSAREDEMRDLVRAAGPTAAE